MASTYTFYFIIGSKLLNYFFLPNEKLFCEIFRLSKRDYSFWKLMTFLYYNYQQFVDHFTGNTPSFLPFIHNFTTIIHKLSRCIHFSCVFIHNIHRYIHKNCCHIFTIKRKSYKILLREK